MKELNDVVPAVEEKDQSMQVKDIIEVEVPQAVKLPVIKKPKPPKPPKPEVKLFRFKELNPSMDCLPLSYLINYNSKTGSFDDIKHSVRSFNVMQGVVGAMVNKSDIVSKRYYMKYAYVNHKCIPLNYDIVKEGSISYAYFHKLGKLNILDIFNFDLGTIKFHL